MKIIRFLSLIALLLFVALSTLLQGQGIESTLQEPQLNSSKNYFEIIMENIGAILGGLGAAIAAYASYSAFQSKKSAGKSRGEIDEFRRKFRDELWDASSIDLIKTKGKLFSESDIETLESRITHMLAKENSALLNAIKSHCKFVHREDFKRLNDDVVGVTMEVEALKTKQERTIERSIEVLKEGIT